MARKRHIFFRILQPFLRKISFNTLWFKRILLALLTALVCATSSPIWAKVPAMTARVQVLDRSLLQQGKTFYDGGQYAQAVEVLKTAIAEYDARGDKVNQALTLSNLSLAYQQLNLWDEANSAIAL